MESCSIEVGNSVNIKRSDGEWKKRDYSKSFCQFREEKNGFSYPICNYLEANFLFGVKSESLQCPRAALAMQFLIGEIQATHLAPEEHKKNIQPKRKKKKAKICIKIEFDSFIFFALFPSTVWHKNMTN